MNLESQKAAEICVKSLKIALKIVRCNEVGTSFALIVQKKKSTVLVIFLIMSFIDTI